MPSFTWRTIIPLHADAKHLAASPEHPYLKSRITPGLSVVYDDAVRRHRPVLVRDGDGARRKPYRRGLRDRRRHGVAVVTVYSVASTWDVSKSSMRQPSARAKDLTVRVSARQMLSGRCSY